MLKIIYLSIHFSHVGLEVTLNYDNINTMLLLFQKKKFLYFFPLWNCTLGFFKRKKSYNLLLFPFFFNFIFVEFFFFFLDTFFGFDCMVEKIGFETFCLKLKE